MAIVAPQQLNMEDRILIRPALVRRCTAIVTNLALYILGEDAGATNHVNRANWADNAIKNAGSVAEQVSWHVLNQDSFLNGGSSIEDGELKSIVEFALIAHFIAPLT